ncbi:CocE/NonD family hydrolase [Sphingomonas profundi]|uniref:CocE/NonD family hydrolase n=1 Tax=Alterirhizorhabdus profundi TaxID=2681549 RepID=UPI0012E8B5E8|nr:CocE/NonD family hydrolase [Sphingomonas profundi]
MGGLGALTAILLAGALPAAAAAAPPVGEPSAPVGALFTYREVMVPMRDGARLQTVIMTPTNATGPLPILLTRTPYGVPDKAPAEIPPSRAALAADGYIFVYQNIRGRFKSEGVFSLTDDFKVTPGKGTIETHDGWDTIDWLVKNVPGNNGRVGIFGVSYSGYTSAATLLDPHPALKAVSEQASPADDWMNDDGHRYGALRLSYVFEYGVLEEADKTANTRFGFDRWDTYDWYLAAGPLSAFNDKYLHGRIGSWNDAVAHPDYDDFWQGQAWYKAIDRARVPTLNVAGFWDQEDPWGPWQIHRRAATSDPDGINLMVAGPWNHGAWRRDASKLGPMALGQDTGQSFRREIEAPFFAYWLHGKGQKPDYAARMFETGSNTWRTYKSWPPASTPTRLYLHADGSLSFTAPAPGEPAYREYVSDPANPVPYRQRPVSPTYPGGEWPDWESADQRFVDHRPDVLTFTSAPLEADLTIAGAVSAELFASTSGTDSDFVVKLIDVFPEQPQVTRAEDPLAEGPKPGEYARSPNGYQLPIAMEVRRGRFLRSFERPTPLPRDKAVKWQVPLRDRDHVFRAGHRIMVQVQSSWFPVIDRNPQTFVPSIPKATAADYVSARQRVYTSASLPSFIVLPLVLRRGEIM